MTLSTKQKIGLALFVCSLLPAYLFASWRHEANESVILEELDRARGLLESSEKLNKNCEANKQREGTSFDANYQICIQGEKNREQASQKITEITTKQELNNKRMPINVLLALLVINACGFGVYKLKQLLSDSRLD